MLMFKKCYECVLGFLANYFEVLQCMRIFRTLTNICHGNPW